MPGEGMVTSSTLPRSMPLTESMVARTVRRSRSTWRAGPISSLPAGAEHHAAADPVEQRHPELALQAGDGLRQRRLCDVQLLGRPPEAVVVDDREEVLELPSVHLAPTPGELAQVNQH